MCPDLCIVTSLTAASGPLHPDGSFALNVPDFSHDPVVAAYDDSDRGELRLRLRERGTGNFPYEVDEIHHAGAPIRLPIATSYPRDVTLVAVPAR